MLLACLRMRTLEPGGVLFAQGAAGDTMVLVGDGKLSIRIEQKPGESHEIGVVSPGELLGEMACIDPAPRSATVIASTTAIVFELGRDGLDALRRMAPALASLVVGGVIRDVTRRLREVDARIERELAPRTAPTEAQKPAPAPAAAKAKSPSNFSGFWRIVDRLKGDT
jgi:hypothetical protein